jgi:hypothetical protein
MSLVEYQLPMVIEQPLVPAIWKKKRKVFNIKEFVQMYREPVVTYAITPNNAPEAQGVHDTRSRRRPPSFQSMDDFENDVYGDSKKSELLLNTINGLFSKFYAPERIRLSKNGIKVKLNDLVSYKIAIINGEMKFYLTVPQKWAKGFTSAIKRDWGQVDITKVSERIVDFNPKKAKAMEIHLRHHYALSIKHSKEQNDSFFASIASLASTLDKGDKILIDYNIEPTNNKWKESAVQKIRKFKEGKAPSRDEAFTVNGILGKFFDMFNVIFDEFTNMIEELMGAKDA